MLRIVTVVLVWLLVGLQSRPIEGQAPTSLRLVLSVAGPDGQSTPVARFALQITENPASAPPRRTVTGPDGSVEIRIAPGNYTVESVEPLSFGGAQYQWAVIVDVVAGQRTTLTLSDTNAERLDAAEETLRPDGRVARASVLARWQGSAVEVWSPVAHGAGVLVGRGLVATDRTVVGASGRVAVQFTPTLKVEGVVVATDVVSGLALVRVHDDVAGAVNGTLVPCASTPALPTVSDEVAALVRPMGSSARVTVGYVDAVGAPAIATDLDDEDGARGAPVFDAALAWMGVAVMTPPSDDARTDRLRVMPSATVCALAQTHAAAAAALPMPSSSRLPVEPAPTPNTPVSGAAESLSLASIPRMTSDDFDITFLASSRVVVDHGRRGVEEPWQQLVTEFANWTAYVERRFPVVFVRVTPRLTEGLWGKLARGVAITQGVSLPPLKRLKPNFARLRVLCGTTEVPPIQPFVLEHDLSETDRLVEGFYVFDPAVWRGECASVRLELASVAAPTRIDVVTVPSEVLARLRKDLS